MFKKMLSIILCFILVLSFAGCGQTASNPAGDSNASSSAAPDVATGESVTDTTASAQIEVEENLLTVDITLPASLFEGEDMTTFDASAYANEQGFSSAKVNEDGSITVTMTKAKYNDLLAEMSASLDTAFAEFVGAESTPYIKGITHNDNFTEVTMKVDRAAYENAFDFTPLAIGISVSVYQAFVETEYHVEITVVDAETGDTINTIIYPDALGG